MPTKCQNLLVKLTVSQKRGKWQDHMLKYWVLDTLSRATSDTNTFSTENIRFSKKGKIIAQIAMINKSDWKSSFVNYWTSNEVLPVT